MEEETADLKSLLSVKSMGQDTAGEPLQERILRALIKPLHSLILSQATVSLWYQAALTCENMMRALHRILISPNPTEEEKWRNLVFCPRH